jgi:hypothetical protein
MTTIYTLTTDTDHGTTTAVFTDYKEAIERTWAFVLSYDSPHKNLRELYADPHDAWAELQENAGFMDSMSLDSHEIDLPDAPVNAGLLAVLETAKKTFTDVWVREGDRTAVLSTIDEINNAIAAAEAQPTADTLSKPIDAPPPSPASTELQTIAADLEQIVADLREAGLGGDSLDQIDRHSTALEAMAAQLSSPVKIEVSGGVAEVTECPRGISVEIVDHDKAGQEV